MCPFCIATAAVIAGSATGTGGVTALIAGTLLKRTRRKDSDSNAAKEVDHGNDNNGGEHTPDRLSQ